MRSLSALLLSTTAALVVSTAAFAQTPASAPPPGEGPGKSGNAPKGQQAPVIDPAEVPATQGDTVAPPTRPTPPSGVVPATPATPANPSTTPPLAKAPAVRATPASPATRGSTLVNGTSVRDAQGNVIGMISKVGTGSNAGQVTLTVDGRTVTVAQSVLTQNGDLVVSSETKAQLLAQASVKGKTKKN